MGELGGLNEWGKWVGRVVGLSGRDKLQSLSCS